MSVEVASCTLAQLFSKQSIVSAKDTEIHGQLAIPEYQRPYCWTEVQLQRLLQDRKASKANVSCISSALR